jgi:tetratricopeptide (TPR) repeat protein
MKFRSITHPRAGPIPAAMRLGTVIRGVALAVALGGLAAMLAVTGTRLDRAASAAARADEPVYLPRAEYLRPMSLGWQNVLADIIWFRTISYFGQHYRSDRTYPWLAQMCELVTDLDPRAEHVYRFAGFVLPWEADQSEAGIRLLEKGARQFPDSWLLHYYAGFHHYFFRDDYPRALEHLRRAMQLPGAHPAVARLAAGLAAEEYGPETTLAFFSELERNAESADLRNVLRDNMDDVRLAVELQRVAAAADAYRQRTGQRPATVEAIVQAGLLPALPVDPSGGRFVIDRLSGEVRTTSGRTPSRIHHSKVREKVLRGDPVRHD